MRMVVGAPGSGRIVPARSEGRQGALWEMTCEKEHHQDSQDPGEASLSRKGCPARGDPPALESRFLLLSSVACPCLSAGLTQVLSQEGLSFPRIC